MKALSIVKKRLKKTIEMIKTNLISALHEAVSENLTWGGRQEVFIG